MANRHCRSPFSLRQALSATLLAAACSGTMSLAAADITDPFDIYPLPKHRYDAMTEAEQALRQLNFAQAEAVLVKGAEEQRGLERRARPLQARIDSIEAVFDGLATRDQLSRELSAHPLCVEITMVGGDKRHGVPVAAPNDAEFADTDRPAAYLQRKLEQNGRAYILTDKGAVETLIDGKVESVAVFDSAAIRAEKAAEFDQRWQRMQGSELLDDPINWYGAAKFAYRWSLDDWVVPLVEEALKRKEDLVLAVQEDLATDYLTKVVESLDKDDRHSAGGWLGQMRKHFPKTLATKQAAALFNNDDAALAAANKESAEEDAQIIVAEVTVTPEPQPTAAKPEPTQPVVANKPEPKPVQQQPTSTPKPAAKPAAQPGRDAASTAVTRKNADKVFAEANRVLKKAQKMPNMGRNTDATYDSARDLFTQAQKMYQQLGVSNMVVKAKVGRSKCMKMLRF